MAIYLPRRWRHQPQGAVEVDWRNPLAQSLEAFFLAPGGFFGPVGQFDTNTPYVSKTVTASSQGIARDLSSANGGYEVRHWAQRTGRYNGALAVGWTPTSVGGENNYGVAGFRDLTAGNARLYLRHNKDLTSGFRLNDSQSFSTGPSWPLLRYGVIAAEWDAGGARAFFNGRGFYAGSTLKSAMTEGRLGNIPTASAPSSTSYFAPGLLHWAACWSRPLGDAQQNALAENPYQIFRAPSHRIFFDLGAANAIPTLSLAGVQDVGKTSARPKVTLTF